MTTTVGFGPLARVIGPPRIPQKYGLLQAASAPNTGVRIVTDADAGGYERWGLGGELEPAAPGLAGVFVRCGNGSDADEKVAADNLDKAIFSPFEVVYKERCKAISVLDQAAYKARAVAALTAVEGATVEREILTGTHIPGNPHLADGTGDFPLGDNPTSPVNGIAILEAQIARSGSGGIIHVSPQLATYLASNLVIDVVNGALRTTLGTTVIAGYGYVDGATPRDGHTVPTGWEEWAYATGPIDIRRSAIELLPEELAQAFEIGYVDSEFPNTISYTAEREYLVDWDGDIHAAVLVDLCTTECGSAPS